MSDDQQVRVTVDDRDLRVVVRQALNGVALALIAAAVTVFVMMVVVFISPEYADERDWPGSYWFAVVPLLVAAASLNLSAARIAPTYQPGDDA